MLLTFRLTVADCASGPLVPVIFREKVPTGVFFMVDTVTVELPDPVTEVGLKVAVASAGKPLTLNATTPLNPFTAVIFAVYVVLAPFFTVCEPGVAEIVKLDTTSVTVVLWVRLPLVPVMVKV